MAVMVGASIGLAGSASADPLIGSYSAKVTGGNIAPLGAVRPWVFTSCGADCTSREVPGDGPSLTREFHRQGNTWTTTTADGSETVDADTLVAHSYEPAGSIDWQLTKS
ncbi:hypothetical protein PT015_05075 [Candidatus Mycobacterium wuenschmannii]|uniref:Secreted protein n=1 Tax=Candidatus Mycobacterium wuenschmannii TaxID=3027808 RepID=A0ABY8W359_9MYCO|nr:hypothetical protein [Candidatus Mycobacterium wuenschmannii]WIM88853.1 hypothetical protein PT015_05075 [Candidatus Mycobacterium wuenschmannii]